MSLTFETTILGSSAATPTSLRHTTAQLIKHRHRFFLADCGEGCQMQLRRLKLPLMKINHIFISHLHGDHYLGLPGLLFTFHLLGRNKVLNLYSPPGLKEIIDLQYQISGLQPSYNIHYHELKEGGALIYEDTDLTVHTLAMDHRLSAFGFLFKENVAERRLRKDSLSRYHIPLAQRQAIKQGADLHLPDGRSIANSKLTHPPLCPRSYAFCSDTAYTESFIDQIRGADLLYHEATFMHDKAAVAKEKTHSTTIEAATLAKKAGVNQLMIGHYSARYKELEAFRNEAGIVFPNTILAEEGQTVQIGKYT